MAILSFLVQLAGATMLLLFAVRMVRTGIERSYGASFQRILTGQSGLAYSGAAGVVLAGVLQSSAAVALLVAGFASNGLITFANGLALVLGGDLGSALIIQVLTFRLDWLVPLLLTAGGWLFVKVTARKWRQMGRILMGIAFILISLRFLRETMDPIRDSAFLPAIANYLAQDYLTAFFVGATLAFVMHSSVAAILMCVTLVQIGAIPFSAGLSLVLGANLGSAFIPIWLTRGMPNAARRIPFANLATRGTWALMALFAVNLLPAGNILTDRGSGQMLVYAHVVFNASLLLLLLPFCRPLEPVFRRFLPDAPANSGVQTGPDMLRSLDPNAIGSPQQAIADLKRELLRMMDQVELMFRPVIALYRTWDKDQVKTIETMDQRVNQSLSDIRNFVAAIPQKSFTKDQARAARDMMEYAIRLEAAGDIVTLRFAPLAGVAAAVYYPDGRICEMNRPSVNPFWNVRIFLRTLLLRGRDGYHISRAVYAQETTVHIDLCSFVGFFVSRRIVRQTGLPDAKLFLYGDDVIYTLRLRKEGFQIQFDPRIRFEHDCSTFENDRRRVFRPIWKVYYAYRNGLLMYHQAAGLMFWPLLLLVVPKWWLAGRRYGDERAVYSRLMRRAVRDAVLRRTELAHDEVLALARPVSD